jgi:ABC-2 type transport system ATP-binding protein
MEEVEEISTRIIIIDHGKIIAEGTNEKLKERLADEKLFSIETENISGFDPEKLYKIEGIENIDIKDGLLKISVLKGIENLDKIITLLISNAVRIQNITSEEENLEMVFLKLTGRTLRD